MPTTEIKEKPIASPVIGGAELQAIREVLESGKMSLDGLITHEFHLDRINEALDLFRSGEAGRIIVNMAEG